MFDIRPADAAPIWQQIEDGMRRMIVLGALKPGDAVPSVRDLARTLRVNPNTVARAYQRLIDGGLFASRRGDGTYVADEPPQPKRSERNDRLRDGAMGYAGVAISVGASSEEASQELASAFARLVREHRRKS
ncbi:MAG TPA: GntR family transcriptional regulator [Thermoanaerobaculia bacterium]